MEQHTAVSNYPGDAADLASIINPSCHACKGSGTDTVFGTPCSECRHESVLAARYAGVRTSDADRAYTPGERMDGRTWGNSAPSNEASEKQVAFLTKLLSECKDEAFAATVREQVPTLNKKQASAIIENLLQLNKAEPKEASSAPAGARTNRYPGQCVQCGSEVAANAGLLFKQGGRWATQHKDGECVERSAAPAAVEGASGLDLSSLPSGRYAVPGGDTRLKLKIDNVDKGKWEGWVFVKDAAEYGQQKRYGKQAPGKRYSGDVQEALQAILADPKAAAAAYGHLTSTCGVCNAPLENEESVERGIGPICAQKF